jgi:3',5'-cyclic AMP phosphodiesterase CpdA
MTVRVVMISDTHLQQGALEVPPGDILIHAGDFTFKGREAEVREFGKWFRAQPHTHKCLISGNHDLSFESNNKQAVNWLYDGAVDDSFHYLQDASVVVEVGDRKIKVYGSPWQPEFGNWAFNLPRGIKLKAKWAQVPSDTDILITHGPPENILDMCDHGESVGCKDLLDRVMALDLKIHCFGHIHEAYGQVVIANTTFVNASICNLRYHPSNKPIVVDI